MLVGQRRGVSERDLLVYSIETKRYQSFGPADPGPNGAVPVFLADGKRIAYLGAGRLLSIVDFLTRRPRPVAGMEAIRFIGDFVVTKDNRFMYAIDNQIEADVWMGTLH
jgi:hypothetical protein